jgi:preprotein translocase subunit YajC
MSHVVSFVVGLGLLLFGGAVAFGQEETGSQTASGQQSIISLVAILVIFAAVFYFMLIRPQRKRQAKHNVLLRDLKRGDKVITAGGVYGEIDSVGDTSIVLTVEDGGKLRLAKSSIIDKRAK